MVAADRPSGIREHVPALGALGLEHLIRIIKSACKHIRYRLDLLWVSWPDSKPP
ncbi:hypothetical protein FDG2_4617 [Candidatus Protofrankia californiensis]|uniref:Uncharacterized protein n=1 Tax=Candidatus Protofrankia californiensis TaxID=1839754 RepID=A0A1C3P6Z2_9ACTN|nr:hypothetical protein FDG2_4617 [Candidatus Protofrankia californiensis]